MFDPDLNLETKEASEDIDNIIIKYDKEIEQLKANLEPFKCQMGRRIDQKKQILLLYSQENNEKSHLFDRKALVTIVT